MGNCITCYNSTSTVKIAIKVPHGVQYIEYNNRTAAFEKKDDINNWISSLYINKNFTHWVIYNDETSHIEDNKTAQGHCKGIVSWNQDCIGWLCHSVPNFPRNFSTNFIFIFV